MEEISKKPIETQYEETVKSKEWDHAWKEAHRSARRGKILASHVVKMLQSGEKEDRAKMGKFPNRYPYLNVDEDSVTIATNAELKASGNDIKVDVYDASLAGFDPVYRKNVRVVNLGNSK